MIGTIDRQGLSILIGVLHDRGYKVIGPRVEEGAIGLGEVSSVEDLPVNVRDIQGPGEYRLEARDDEALFGYTVPLQSYKRVLYPPRRSLFRSDSELKIQVPTPEPVRYAFLGIRACDLRAIEILDHVLTSGPYIDTDYQRRREGLFLVAVQCTEPGDTCFCVSTNSGPSVDGPCDLVMTELPERGLLVVEARTDEGKAVLRATPHKEVKPSLRAEANERVDRAVQRMGRRLDTAGIEPLLNGNLQHARYDEVARRCLACGNCTLVCPTCFCVSVRDHTDVATTVAERVRSWDSCFTTAFSYVHGGAVRPTVRARYRQWLTHKLANWMHQFGTLGCVGCGRCITWCPAGIDLTEEVAAIRRDQALAKEASGTEEVSP